MAHLARQQGLVFEGMPKLGVRLLPLNGDTEQSGKTRQEIRIRKVELSSVRAIDFENAERQMAFAAPRDQDIDRALDAVIGEQLRRSKARFLLKVVGDDDLPGMERITGGRFHVDPKRYAADRSLLPPDSRAYQQPFFVRQVFEDLGERRFEPLGAKLGGPL